MKSLGPLTALALAAAIAPASVLAASAQPAASSAGGGVTYNGTNGGAVYGEPVATEPPVPKPKPEPKRKPASVAARPQLQAFSVGPAVVTPGQAPTAHFTIKDVGNGTSDVVPWTSRDSLALGSWAPTAARFTATPSTEWFVPQRARAWRVALPGDSTTHVSGRVYPVMRRLRC